MGLLDGARIPPVFVQNRCYANRGWDELVRNVCDDRGLVYQGFSLLTANRGVMRHRRLQRIARTHGVTAAQVIFRFALQLGMIPLTGTTSADHMRCDLEIYDFSLGESEMATILRLGR